MKSSIHIRPGQLTDAPAIAEFLMLAMSDITYRFIGQEDENRATAFLQTLVEQPGNQYSYTHHWVVEDQGQPVGTALVYDGGRLEELREPVGKVLKAQFGVDFNPENETEPGEYYIDCIGVSPSQQGKGIGSQILEFLKEEYVQRQGKTLGLLVDLDNPKAKKLYERLGFVVIKERLFMGKVLEHMQIQAEKG